MLPAQLTQFKYTTPHPYYDSVPPVPTAGAAAWFGFELIGKKKGWGHGIIKSKEVWHL